MKIFVTLLVLLIVLLAGAAVFIWSGAYNVAATAPHTEFVHWLLVKIRDQSIAEHSKRIEPPPLTDPALVQTGLRHYHAMCVTCHGAPGRDRTEIAQGLNPPPPELYKPEVQNQDSNAELYWIIKHGIKMTGMPAFGPTHTEKDLWAIVAFLHKLPHLKAQEYEAMVEAAGIQDGAREHTHRHEATYGRYVAPRTVHAQQGSARTNIRQHRRLKSDLHLLTSMSRNPIRRQYRRIHKLISANEG